MNKQLTINFGEKEKFHAPCSAHEAENIPFVNEVETFNAAFGKKK